MSDIPKLETGKLLCSYLGGSHLYGLNTPQSDVDIRYVFLNTELGEILGLDRLEHIDRRNKDEDTFGMELRGFLGLLRKTNTQVMELLFARESAFTLLDPKFKSLVLDKRTQFIDSNRFYKSLKGYIFTERRLALGERAGQIGGKRYEQVEKYGYSPKNMVQLFRLSYCGVEFFRTGNFPCNMKEYREEIWTEMMAIKTRPEEFNPQELVERSNVIEGFLDIAFETTKISYNFDLEYANWVCAALYEPILNEYLQELHL